MNLYDGTIFTEENKCAVVISENSSVYHIPLEEMGGISKENKISSLLGATISFIPTIKKGDIFYASRKEALSHIQSISKKKVSDIVEARVLSLFGKTVLVEALGQEVYMHGQDLFNYFVEDVIGSFKYGVGDKFKVKVVSLNPLKLSLREIEDKFDDFIASMYKPNNVYFGTVVSTTEKSIFVQLPMYNVVVTCRIPEWKRSVIVGDSVVCIIKDIDKEQHRCFGFIKTLIKKGSQ